MLEHHQTIRTTNLATSRLPRPLRTIIPSFSPLLCPLNSWDAGDCSALVSALDDLSHGRRKVYSFLHDSSFAKNLPLRLHADRLCTISKAPGSKHTVWQQKRRSLSSWYLLRKVLPPYLLMLGAFIPQPIRSATWVMSRYQTMAYCD